MNGLTFERLRAHFPHDAPRDRQEQAFHAIVESDTGVTIEMPTGEGKTDTGMTPLLALAAQGVGPVFYVTPTKVLVDQIRTQFGDRVIAIFGRSEYRCLYYACNADGTPVTAQESPCYMLSCKHRVNQETGETEVAGAEPCPYFKAKYEARKRAESGGGVIVTTTAFFLINRMMVGGWRELEPALTVVDEAHGIADIARNVFEYTLTDFHLRRCISMLRVVNPEQSDLLQKFLGSFMAIVRSGQREAAHPDKPALLKEEQIEKLVAKLDELDAGAIEKSVNDAVAEGSINPMEDRDSLKVLEHLVRGIPRLLSSLRYALEEENRKALNYVIAFHYRKDDHAVEGTQKKARYFLTIKSYFVHPVIRKALGSHAIVMSATIGNPKIYKFETGIGYPFVSLESSFNVKQTRVWMPCDAPDLAFKAMRGEHGRRGARRDAIKMVVDYCADFSDAGHRSLVVVVAEEERQRFLRMAGPRGLNEVVSYGNGRTPKDAATAFKAGEGKVLIGTAAQYAQGLDLPAQTAPIIWFLRPGFAPPYDPRVQFEVKRFGGGATGTGSGHCWALWNWRAMIQALQVRGRNIRGPEDMGVCFFVSSQFQRFLYRSLPGWLKPAYRKNQTFDAAVAETLKLLR